MRRTSAAVNGMSSWPLLSVMTGGGLYVLGRANRCPQAAGPLVTGACGGGRLGRQRSLAAGPAGMGEDGQERMGEH